MKSIHQKQSWWCWRNEKKKKQLRKNLKNGFRRGEADWTHAGYFNLYPRLCKLSITLSVIMDCEKCDWTGMEKEQDLWSDGSAIRVINICCMTGRMADALLTSAVSWELDISTFQKPKCHYSIKCWNLMFMQSHCAGCPFKCAFSNYGWPFFKLYELQRRVRYRRSFLG